MERRVEKALSALLTAMLSGPREAFLLTSSVEGGGGGRFSTSIGCRDRALPLEGHSPFLVFEGMVFVFKLFVQFPTDGAKL